jgi:hypothetical protein
VWIEQKFPLGCTRHLYNLDVKKAIVDNAFALLKNLRATEHKFSIQPMQICSWKRKFDSVAVTRSNTTTTIAGNNNIDRPSPPKKFTESRFDGGGRKPLLNDDAINWLKEFYDSKREEDLVVTLHLMMMAECRLLDLSACTLSPKALLVVGEMGCVLESWDTQGAKHTP